MLRTTTTIEPKPPGAHVMWEADRNHSRDPAVLAKHSEIYQSGTVLSFDVSTREHVRLKPAATDGTQTAVAVLFGPVDAREVARGGVVSARASTVRDDDLVWPEGITEEQAATAAADLNARGIVVR